MMTTTTTMIVKPVRRTAWWNVSCILVAELVGTGVLGLPYTFSVLGGALGLAFLLLFGGLAYFSGVLLWRLHHAYPDHAVTYPDLAGAVGGPFIKRVVFLLLYVAFFGNLAVYIVVCRGTLEAMLDGWSSSSTTPCQTTLSLVTVAVLFPVAQLKTLHGVSFVALGSAVCVFLAILLILADCLSGTDDGDAQNGGPQGAAAQVGDDSSSHGWLTAFSASTTAVFAFGGQGLYLETMAEMRRPLEFRRALRCSSTGILLVYVVTASVAYARYGDAVHGNVFDNVSATSSSSWLRRTVAALLFLHVAVSYALANQVVCRAAAVRLVPHLVDRDDWYERAAWAALSTSVLLTSWVVAEGVPFFHLLMGLVGAASTAPLTFGFPAWFWLQRIKQQQQEEATVSVRASSNMDEATLLLGMPDFKPEANNDGTQQLRGNHNTEKPLLWAMIIITLFLFVIGIYANIVSLVDKWSEQGQPFACHPAVH